MPVATQDNPAALAPFEDGGLRSQSNCRAHCEPVTLKIVKDSLAISKREKVPQGFGARARAQCRARWSYALDPTSPSVRTCSSMSGHPTLDVVAFNLIDQEGMPEIKAFAASVELLGAAALDVATRHAIDDADFSRDVQPPSSGIPTAWHATWRQGSFSRKNNPDSSRRYGW